MLIRRILLINPFQITSAGYDYKTVLKGSYNAEAPLGLAYLAAVLGDEKKYIVEIYDMHIEAIKFIMKNNGDDCGLENLYQLLWKKLHDFNPDVVGISCLFHVFYRSAHNVCKYVKKYNPEIFTIMGGSYPTNSPNEAMEDPNLDFAILAEGDITFLSLIKHLQNDLKLSLDIDGIAYRRHSDGEIIINPKTNFIKNIDALPFPARHLLPIEDYSRYAQHAFLKFTDNPVIVITMNASRGCPYSCTFCSESKTWGRNIRYRSPESVIEEMEQCIEQYDTKYFALNDDNILINRRFVMQFTKLLLDKKLEIRWYIIGGITPGLLDQELVDRLVSSGMRNFGIAIESGSQEILKKINKPVQLDKIPAIIKMIRKHSDTYIEGFFIVGFPYETKEQIEETLDCSSLLDLDWSLLGIFNPYPGCALYEECIKLGYIDKDKFDYENLFNKNPQFKSPNFTHEYIAKVHYLANLKDNFINNRNLLYGNIDQAIRDFRFICFKFPDHAIAHYSLARALKKKGLISEAKMQYEKAKEIVSNNKTQQGYIDHFSIDLNEFASH